MSVGHSSALVFITAWTVAVMIVVSKHPEKGKSAAKCLGLLMVGSELLRDGILIGRGEFSVGYLPLHLCSFCMCLCLVYGFFREDRGSFLCLIGLPGSICALLFPNWGELPLFYFISLHGYFFHALLLQASLLPLVTGQQPMTWQDLFRAMGVLILAAGVVYPCNLFLGTNYMFLRWPSPDSPLEYLATIPGAFGYQAGLVLLSFGVLTLVWSLLFWIQKRCRIYKDF